MTSRPDPFPPEPNAATPRLDADWLLRNESVTLGADAQVRWQRVRDADTGRWWLVRQTDPEAGNASLQNELRLAQQLDPVWAATPTGTFWNGERMVSIFDATAGSTLVPGFASEPKPMEVGTFLSLAALAADAVAGAHAAGWLHGDLRPAHLIVDDMARVRLTGFGSARPLGAGAPVAMPSGMSMPYLAPELSRAASPGADVRTDLYALGIVFYEWLVGVRPFQADTSAGWQHAHVAVLCAAPQTVRETIPEALGDIVMKLIAKDPHDRFASASALADALRRCRDGHVPVAGPDDIADGSVDRRLFGRDVELTTVHQAFARVAATAHSEMVLIVGGAGAGKSALVDRLARERQLPATRFAIGKSDQRQRDIPFASLAQVLHSLTMAWLGAPEAALSALRTRWLAALDGQGRAIAELVPEIEHVIGHTPPLHDVPVTLARERLETAMMASFSALAPPGSPLVVFVDDLQWADAASIALLDALSRKPPPNLLLIGAYRDQSPEIAEQFGWFFHANRAGLLPITRVLVKPLTVTDLSALIAARLGTTSAHVASLAVAVHRKTDGNPFFAQQLLRALVDDGVVRRENEASAWVWDEGAVASRRYTDNVVDLMIQRFARLPESGTTLLRHFACVGIRCDAALLARVANLDTDALHARLRPFAEAGLIVAEAQAYVFQHDRVLESAYATIPAAQRPAAHARIAGIMTAHWCDCIGDHAFDICNQIERAADHAFSESERVACVDALTIAGRRAKRTAAMAQATRYMNAASALMRPSWWQTHYPQAYGVSLLRCECLLAEGQLDDAAREIDAMLARDMPPIDCAAVHRLHAVLHTVRSDYETAITSSLSGLALLDISLQRHPTRARQRAAFDAVMLSLGGRGIGSLDRLPTTDDPRIHTAMGLLATLISSWFCEQDGLSFTHVAKMVELTLDHGVTAESPYGLAWFGVLIAALYDEYEDGLAYALAATRLLERHGFAAERIATLVALDQVSAWTRPMSFALAQAQSARKLGRASGDIGMACYACNHIASDLLFMGEHLQLVDEEIENGLALTRVIAYRDIELVLYSQQQFARRMRTGEVLLDAPASDRTSYAVRLGDSRSVTTCFWIWLYEGMTHVFLGEPERASTPLAEALALAWSAPAHINVADCHLYIALAAARSATTPAQRAGALAMIERHRERFDEWARRNPLTFNSKLWLLDAERWRLLDNRFEALACYEQSAEAAGAAGFVHEQALAHEYAATLCQAHGLRSSGRHHLRRAYAAYRRWGADHKASRLAAAAPELLTSAPMDDGHAMSRGAGDRGTLGWALGVKAAQAMSGEIVMDRLIEALMTHFVVHAGAQHALLLLMGIDGPTIEASARVIDNDVAVSLGSAVPTEQALPLAVLNTVMRTQQTLVLDDAGVDAPSMRGRGANAALRSVACLPLMRGGNLIGVFYLENNLAPGVFDAHRIAELEVLGPQVAISLETARLYEQLITENDGRLSAEMDLRVARAELARKSHLTTMGSMAASIAHEVNQPLTAIVASVDASLRWLNRAQPDLAEVQEGLVHIKDTSLRAADIIRALRSLAKQAPTELTQLSPDDVVRDVLRIARPEIDAHAVRVTTDLQAGQVQVTGDRVQLQQVVLNLVTNALDAMAQVPVGQRVLAVSSVVTDAGVEVAVRDHGAGIDADVLARIFDPFFTTKSAGLGMGLAICRSIIETHGGTLDAQPCDAGGSVFTFRLPLPERNA